jgi:phage-related protein
MSDSTYTGGDKGRKPIGWLHGAIKSPPFSRKARIAVGALLGRLQAGELLGMPHSRPMPAIGPRCHELRIAGEGVHWRIVYRIDVDAIQIVEVFAKTTRATPKYIIDACRSRLSRFDHR